MLICPVAFQGRPPSQYRPCAAVAWRLRHGVDCRCPPRPKRPPRHHRRPRGTTAPRAEAPQAQQLTIRPGSLCSDLDALCALEDASRPSGHWSRQAVCEELVRPRAVTLVAEAPAGLVGWVAAWHVPPDECHILEVAVHPRHRRRGVASTLLRELVSQQAASGAHLILLEVREGNAGAISLYETLGFRTVGRRPRYYHDTGEAAVLMNLELGDLGLA